jgi:GT2 family glycosyltransferase
MTSSKKSESNIVVLLAHFNDNERLEKAILSIKETIPVDVFIVDDGSKIKPNEIELQKIYNGGKLKVLLLDKNYGLKKVRNFGLKEILKKNYKYIAILDSDDLNKENRFQKQFNYLENNKTVSLIGSWCDYINKNGDYLYTEKFPTSDLQIKKKIYLNSMFVHSTIFFRTCILKEIGLYPEKYFNEDYAFLFKITRNYKVENYPESLIYYLINEEGHSSNNRKKQVLSRLKIIIDNFYIGFYPIYGLIRNIPLLFMSRNFLTYVKKNLFKKEDN